MRPHQRAYLRRFSIWDRLLWSAVGAALILAVGLEAQRVAGSDDFGRQAVRLDPTKSPGLFLERFVTAEYPSEFKGRELEGDVLVEAVIRSNGSVGAARVERSLDPVLDRAAVAAVSRWRFQAPSLVYGGSERPRVDVVADLTVPFRLPSRPGVPDEWTMASAGAHRFGEPGLTWVTQVQVVSASPPQEAIRVGTLKPGSAARVHLEIVVLTSGRVGAVRVLRPSGVRAFDDLAGHAARQRVFAPARVRGEPVPVIVAIQDEFRIH